jgi:hypothetical protein
MEKPRAISTLGFYPKGGLAVKKKSKKIVARKNKDKKFVDNLSRWEIITSGKVRRRKGKGSIRDPGRQPK